MVSTLYEGEDGKMYEVDESRPVILTDDDKAEIKRIILDALDETDSECEFKHIIALINDEINNSFDSDYTEYRAYARSIYDETLEEYEQQKLDWKKEVKDSADLISEGFEKLKTCEDITPILDDMERAWTLIKREIL